MEHVGLPTTSDVLEIVETDAPAPAPQATATATHPDASAALSPDQSLETANELSTWLRALDSFFQWQHHPHGQDRKPDLLVRDWAIETRIAYETIRRARHLALDLSRAPHSDDLTDELNLDPAASAGHAARLALPEELLTEVDDALGDACALSEGLLAAPHVHFGAWLSLGRMLARELRRTAVLAELDRVLRERRERSLHPTLNRIMESAAPATLSADMRQIFLALGELLSRLRYIAPLLKADRPLKQTLPLLTLCHADAKRLVEFIEKRALRTDELDSAIFDTLDSTAYALGMELRKVFAHELNDVVGARHAPLIYSKIETAHGLLRDAFQHSVVTLAQALDPDIAASDLFDGVRTKLDQSLALRADIWSLLQAIRLYERDPTAPSASLEELLARCQAFRDGSMQYLMYKDWEAFDLFVEELSRARTAAEALPVLHRFGAYLDTLLGQINMRAVLKDHPFDSQAAETAHS